MAILQVKSSSSSFYRFGLHNSTQFEGDFYESAKHINDTWQDIECLNYTVHFLLSSLSPIMKNEQFNILFDGMMVISRDLYIHLDIIKKVFETKMLGKVSQPLNDLFSQYKNTWEKIRKVRNLTIIHKDKPNFYQEVGRIINTEPISLIVQEGTYINDKGKEEAIVLKPLEDIAVIYEFLNKFQDMFNSSYPEKM